jgi:hypothetical protein
MIFHFPFFYVIYFNFYIIYCSKFLIKQNRYFCTNSNNRKNEKVIRWFFLLRHSQQRVAQTEPVKKINPEFNKWSVELAGGFNKPMRPECRYKNCSSKSLCC